MSSYAPKAVGLLLVQGLHLVVAEVLAVAFAVQVARVAFAVQAVEAFA